MKSENKKKKEEKETENKSVKVDETEEFVLEKAIENAEIPEMLKPGLNLYINNNNLKINSKTEFNKIINEFQNLKIGG